MPYGEWRELEKQRRFALQQSLVHGLPSR